jgi:DNA replication and repair protein RecF
LRTHKQYSLPLSPRVTLITGDNGSGKTSLLEAIYIVLQGSSFKGGDSEIVRYGAPWYRIDAVLDGGVTRTVKFDPSRTSGKKQFEIDSKVSYRLTYANKYPVVLFDPDELRLINGSPSRRRQFIDRFIAQFDPEYALSLRRYERALKQRNVLLKKRLDKNSLFVWDVSLSKYGAHIIECRTQLIERLRPLLKITYQAIAGSSDDITILYSAQYKGLIEQRLLSEFHQNAERDKILGYTSTGPHRHDILFEMNGYSAEGAASRGEVRTIVLALKFLEVDILKENTGKDPIILLDDVFSELDTSRQIALTEKFTKYQTIITSVDAPEMNYPTITLSS